jgi:arylsulfatase A-like enzyme
MKKTTVYPVSIIAALFMILLTACTGNVTSRPNIILIIADDQSYNTIPCMGNEEVRAPNLEQLAARGTLFTHAYNMGGWHGAVCVASRTMLNTGRFIWGAQQAGRQLDTLAGRGELWSQLMKQAGYETFFSGKWHVNIEPEKIFDHVVHTRPGMPGTVPGAYNRPVAGQQDPWSPFDTTLGGFWEGGRHWSEVLGDDAVEFIRMASQNKDPFFIYLAFNAPHDPRQSPREFVDSYPADRIAVPRSFLPVYPYAAEIGCGEELRDERLAPFPRTEYAVRVHRQEYYAIISHMDQQIGRMLDALEASWQAENTYIFFTADHGLAVGNHGLMGKQNMYDHSLRTPLIVTGPGVKAGQRLDADVYLQDVMPTAVELSGLKVPGYVEFKSLIPHLEAKRPGKSYEAIYGCYMDLQRMIRTDNYKLIAYPYAGRLRLYDLVNDPLEMNDLAGDPGRQKLVRDLFTRLVHLGQEIDDTLDLEPFFPQFQ